MSDVGEYNKYVSYAIILALVVLFFKMIEPYASYLAIGIVLAILLYPVHARLSRLVKNKISAVITTVLALLIIVIPAIFTISSLASQMISFFSQINTNFIRDASTLITELTGQESYIADNITPMLTSVGKYLLSSAPDILGSIAGLGIGLLLMFSMMYYLLVDSDKWDSRIRLILPLESDQKEHLVQVIKKVINSALYGEILIAILQGILGGILFYLLEIPNPVFWGFVMGVLAFLPFVGTAIVWAPVALMRAVNGEVLAAVIVLMYGMVLMNAVDYLLRPKIIAQASRIHPLTAILGAFGGIHLLGFQGLILGPLIAALIEALVIFYYEENSKNTTAVPAKTKKTSRAAKPNAKPKIRK